MTDYLIKLLSLKNFRNHANRNIYFNPGINAIIGPNASGKTSILEAISLLYPGRGIRGSIAANITTYNSKQQYWHSKGRFLHTMVDYTISTEYCNNKKILSINEKKINNSKLLKNTHIIWISPQISHKVIMSMSFRRKFIDRIVYLFHPNHAKLILKYEKAIQERNKLLIYKNYNKNWMIAIEKNLSEIAVNIMFNRENTIILLNKIATNKKYSITPVQIKIVNNTMFNIHDKHKKAIEKMLENFDINRKNDIKTCCTNIGPHRCKIEINNPIKKISIDNASTGEQKLMLISIILIQAIAKKLAYSVTPIILLDDVTTQLDETNINILLNILNKIDCQTIISDTSCNKKYTTMISLKEND